MNHGEYMFQFLTQQLPIFLTSVSQLGLWLAILCVIFVPLEHLFAIHPQKIFRPGISIDLGYFVLSSLLPALLLSLPVGLLAWGVHRFVPYRIHTFAAEAPFWARAVAGLVISDCAYYWAHRWMHTVPVLWRFHAIHHSAPRIDFLVNTRMHPVDMLISRLSGLVPLYVLGITGPVGSSGGLMTVAIILIGKLWGFFIHANVRWRYGPLAWVLSTPAFHHWHHAVSPANRNYASMLPWLDRIFGTYHVPKDAFPSRYGIDESVPENLPVQLIQPFLEKWPSTLAPFPAAAGCIRPGDLSGAPSEKQFDTNH
jgi:sterol desaturase/sphingolipid hydroxylase (fatty acid hydroxylase superfamily)